MKKTDMPTFYNNADILLIFSKHESLELVVLEAMSCDLPVIANNVCAMSEFVMLGETGELVNLDIRNCSIDEIRYCI